MGKLDTEKITDGASCMREIGECLKSNLDDIESSLKSINSYLATLKSYNGSDASNKYYKMVYSDVLNEQQKKWYKDVWKVDVTGKVSSYDFSVPKKNIDFLLKDSIALTGIVKLIDQYVSDVEKELGKGQFEFIFFDPMRTRENGLNKNLLKYYISKENYKKLLEACGGDENEVNRLLDACNDYSKENGCGAYSLLYALNSKKNLNMSKEKFFGDYIMTALGVDEWVKIMKKKADGSGVGPISDVGAKKIFDKAGIDSSVLDNYSKNDFNGSETDKLFEHLKKGGKATIMVESIEDKDYSFEDYKKTFYNFDQKNEEALLKSYNARKKAGYDTSLAKSRHYITITGIDDKGNITYVDSADLNSSNVRHTTYKNLVNHVVSKDSNSNIFNSVKEAIGVIEKKDKDFYYGEGGCVLF